MCYHILSITLGLRFPPGNPEPQVWTKTDARGLATAAGEPATIGIYMDKHTFMRFTSSELTQHFADAPAANADIAVFELYAVLIALRVYPDRFRGKLIGSLIDNPAAAAVLKKTRAQSHAGPLQEQIHNIARAILTELTRLVPGELNPRADAVSLGAWA